jgi:hypothetical protein
VAATTERRRAARWTLPSRPFRVRLSTCSTSSIGFPLAAAVYDALRADCPDTLKGTTNRRWRARIAFALVKATWVAGADGVHSALHVDVPTWIGLQSGVAPALQHRLRDTGQSSTFSPQPCRSKAKESEVPGASSACCPTPPAPLRCTPHLRAPQCHTWGCLRNSIQIQGVGRHAPYLPCSVFGCVM